MGNIIEDDVTHSDEERAPSPAYSTNGRPVFRNGKVLPRYGRADPLMQVFTALGKTTFAFVALLAIIVVGLGAWVSLNPVDATRFVPAVERALEGSLPNGTKIRVDRPVFQMNGLSLAISAAAVSLVEEDTQATISSARDVSFLIRGPALLQGRLAVKQIEAQRIRLPAPDPAAPPIVNLSPGDAGFVEAMLAPIAKTSAELRKRVQGLGLDSIQISSVLRGDRPVARDVSLVLDDEQIVINASAAMPTVIGPDAFDKHGIEVSAQMPSLDSSAPVSNLAMTAALKDVYPLFGRGEGDRPTVFSAAGPAVFSLNMPLVDADAGEALGDADLSIDMQEGEFRTRGEPTKLLSLKPLRLVLQPSNDRVALLESDVTIGGFQSRLFGAALVGARSPVVAERGVPVFEVITNSASINLRPNSNQSIGTRGKFVGAFSFDDQFLELDSVEMVAQSGQFVGSGSIKFEGLAPSVVFNGGFDRLSMNDFLVMWPDIIAPETRAWVLNNLSGGTVSDGQIEVAIPKDILGRLRFGQRIEPDQLNLSVKFNDTSIRGYQDIPRVRQVTADVRLSGMKTNIDVSDGLFWLSDGQKINLDGSTVEITDFSTEPLTLTSSFNMSGEAKAVASVAAGRPIEAFDGKEIGPDDFDGPVTANMGVDIIIEGDKVSARNDWTVDIDFDGVDVTREFDGYAVSDTKLKINLNKDRAVVSGDAIIDGQTAKVDLIEPFGTDTVSTRNVRLRLDNKARKAFGVDLDGLLEGPVLADIELLPDGSQAFDVDITPAELIIPGVGWKKGAGVEASASFNLRSDDGVQRVTNLKLSGGGLRASGSLVAQRGGLRSMNLSSFGLNRGDSASLSIDKQGDVYVISLNGEQFDVRPLIDRAVNTRSSGGQSGGGNQIKIVGKLDRAVGHKGEVLQNASFAVRGTTNNIRNFILDAKAGNGADMNVSLQPNAGSGDQLSLSTQNLGAALRFTNLYGKVTGGSAAVELVRTAENAPYTGALRARNIVITGEPRLGALVNSRAGGERSLNESLRQQINTDQVRFDELTSEISVGQGTLRLTRGTVRGPVVGSTFGGIVYDRNNVMSMNGVFIPAYGINQLIAAIPIIGQIFGRAASGGFLGISWSLNGPFKQPRFLVNPISIFTPGIFREIFNQS